MSVEAKLRYSRISPRKVRLVVNLIRGLQVDEAEKILQFTIKKSAEPILKVLKSAVANAEHNFNLKKANLYITEIKVDGGPMIKRHRKRARGVAFPIQKKTSHLTIKLKEKGGKEGEKKKKTRIEKVYQTEKPKEEITRQKMMHKDEGQGKEKIKEKRGDKKQIFRRKSI